MMKRSIRSLLVAAAISAVLPAAAMADGAVPQLTGVWNSVSHGGYVFGDLTHTEDLKTPKSFAEIDIPCTLTIEKQDGVGLSGTWGCSSRKEVMLGAIRADNKSLVFADEDTLSTAILLSDTEMDFCSQEAGASIIAVCHILKRQ